MFTGLVEEVGRIAGIVPHGGALELSVGCSVVLDGLASGNSVMVNGVCLTVERAGPDGFWATAVRETVNKSTLGLLAPGDTVNLERAARVDGRLEGHIVQGHVDSIGTVRTVVPHPDGSEFRFSVPADLMRLVVYKGSVAVDGISLTVSACGYAEFSVSVIPHTLEHTALRARKPGDRVNIETDIIGRYVAAMLDHGQATGVTEAKLKEFGF